MVFDTPVFEIDSDESGPDDMTGESEPHQKRNNKSEKSTFVNVLSIMNQSDEGKEFIGKYRNLELNVGLRSQLVCTILKETFAKRMKLSRSCLNDMAIQICTIFPREKKVTYQKNHFFMCITLFLEISVEFLK